MQIIRSYTSAHISNLHKVRLYYKSRPLLKHRKDPSKCNLWDEIVSINQDSKEICFLDCAGWIFPLDSIVIESSPISKKYCREAKIFDYREKSIEHPFIFSYCPHLLKYVTLDTFKSFLDIWLDKEMILYFDKRLIQHNYLKYDLKSIIDIDAKITEKITSETRLVRWHLIRS